MSGGKEAGRMSANRGTIIFTGMPGISHQECLNRLNSKLDEKREIASIEKAMCEIRGEELRKILVYPPQLQREIWRAAFEQVLNKDENISNIFLTLHLVYYHQDKREYLSSIDPQLIISSKLKDTTKMIVAFIDDIYDIYKRLMTDDEMFSKVMKLEKTVDRLESIFQSVSNLVSILHWRESETMVSRMIAQMLDVPFFVIATKHSTALIKRLVEIPINDLRTFYVGHSISTVRERNMDMFPKYIEQLDQFMNELIEVSKKTVVFLPDTIDEKRIKSESSTASGGSMKTRGEYYFPELLPRWTLPWDEDDYLSPSLPKNMERINPLNPLGVDFTSSEIKSSISPMLAILLDHIEQQITSRDLTLVEQSSSGVIAYRPHFPYRLSGGVVRELKHNRDLWRDCEENQRDSIILLSKEELGRYRIHSFFTLFESYIDSTSEQFPNKMIEGWSDNNDRVKEFSEYSEPDVMASLVEKMLEKEGLHRYKFIEEPIEHRTLAQGEFAKEQEEKKRILRTICERVLNDELRNEGIINKEHVFIAENKKLTRTAIDEIKSILK